jgi:hypothetical protein
LSTRHSGDYSKDRNAMNDSTYDFETILGKMPSNLEDRIILLCDLADQPFMPRRNGRKIHKSTFYRWISRGIGPNKIKLFSIQIGGSRAVKISDLRDFFKRLNQIELADSPSSHQMDVRKMHIVSNQLTKEGF